MRVVLFTGGDPISYLVRWQTRSKYSHAAIAIPGTRSVIEAYPGKGVRIRELTAKDLTRAEFYDIPGMTMEARGRTLNFAYAMLGEGYDWRGVFRFVSRMPGLVNKRWFCSELVFAALENAGVKLLERIEPECVSPAMLSLSPLLVLESQPA